MQRHFELDLRHMEERFLEMGALVRRAIHGSVEALKRFDHQPAMEVVDKIEPEVNRFHAEIDRLGLDLLALQHPVASDLRFVMAMMKNNNDLERMGDRAVNIALRVIAMLSRDAERPPIDISQMGDAMESMVHDALDAFVRRDDKLAREVLQRDDEVDRSRDTVFCEVMAHINAQPSFVQEGIDLILISRNFERIADHATNIAESVIFFVLGKDVRRAEGNGEHATAIPA